MKGFSEAKTGGGKSPRVSDFCAMQEWTGEWAALRIVGPVMSYCNVWFNGMGKDNKPTSFPKLSLDHDGASDTFVTDICPYRKMGAGREAKVYYVNVIVRDLQEGKSFPKLKGEEGKTIDLLGYDCKLVSISNGGVKKTPVRVLQVNPSVAEEIVGLQKLNFVKMKDGSKKNFEAGHPKYGFDINIKFNKDKKGTAAYSVSKGDRSPLTEEELGYGLWPIDSVKPTTLPAAKADAAELAGRVYIKKSKDGPLVKFQDADEDESESPKKKKGKKSVVDEDETVDMDLEDDEDDAPKNKKKKKQVDEEEEDEDDDTPKSKKKKKAKDEDLEDDLEEDEDDEPKSKKKKKKPVEEDEEEEDEDDEPKTKKKKKPVDEDEDDDSEEDEDDEPKSKKKKKKPVDDEEDEDDDEPKSKKKKKKPADDEDEEEDYAPKKRKPADDEDEDDEPKAKKKKRPSIDEDEDEDDEPKAKKKKKKPVDEDEDDDD